MTAAQPVNSESIPDSQTLPPDVIFPPKDLWSDEPPLESDRHRQQIEILLQSAETHLQSRNFYASGNLTIYYSPNQRKSEDFRGPDFFLVLDVERRDRKSWVVWHEGGRYPHLIIEILSDSTAATDRGLKKQIYQDVFRTPDYFWFDPDTLEFQGFQLLGGTYQPLQPNALGWLWSQQIEAYLGVYESRLRFFSADGQLVPIAEEAIEQERQRAEQERLRAEEERQRAEQERLRAEEERQRADAAEQRAAQLMERLRSAGIDPDLESS